QQDSLGNARDATIGYDGIVGHLPETVTEDGMTTTQRRHPSLGVVVRASDPNGVGTTSVCDTFGRRKATFPDRAGATAWAYSALGDGTGAFAVDETTDGLPALRTVYDRLGRTRIDEQQRFDGNGFAAVGTDYDADGRVARISLPVATGLLSTLADWTYTVNS